MIHNVTLRVLLGASVGLAVWFVLARLSGGMTSLEVVVVLILALGAALATIVGLGRESHLPGPGSDPRA